MYNFYFCLSCNLNCFVFFIKLFDYWFPYHIHHSTWSAQQFPLAQHMHCFFKTSYSPVFFHIYYFNFIPLEQMVLPFFPYMASYTRLFDFTSTYLLDIVGNEQFFSLHYVDCWGWSWGTVWWRSCIAKKDNNTDV